MSTAPMTDDTTHTGGCICGGIRYAIRGPMRPVIYCHCDQCRKTSGNFVAASECEKKALTFISDDTLTWYQSSDAARRGFCSICGGNLFWDRDGDDKMSIFAGTLDAPTGLAAESHIFVADKSDFLTIGDGLPQHDRWY